MYMPSLNHDFVNWDDDAHVYKNPVIHKLDPSNIKNIFQFQVLKTYIPLTLLSFALDYHFFKEFPFIYHFNNVVLHVFVTLLVFFFGMRCGLSATASFIAALIFGLHPMHVESVAWITERKDVLYSLFFMTSLLLYGRYLTAIKGKDDSLKTQALFIGVIVSGVASILAKPMALSLPLILGLMDWYFSRPFSGRVIKEKIYCALALLPFAWITYSSHARSIGFEVLDGMLMWIWCFVFYIRKFFVPDSFALFYQRPVPFSWANPALLVTVLVFIGVWFSVVYFRRKRFYVFCFLFYVLSIFFLLRLDSTADANVVADRFMYLPSVGWCLLIGAGWVHIHKRLAQTRGKLVFYLLSLAALLLLTQKTSQQIAVWKNSVTLWQHQLKTQPLIATDLAYTKLGQALLESDNFDIQDPLEVKRIKELFDVAARINPEYYASHMGLGKLYFKRKDFRQAKAYLEKALKRNPDYSRAYFYLGQIYYLEGRRQEGYDYFVQALDLENDLMLFDDMMDFYVANHLVIDDYFRLKLKYGGSNEFS